MPAATTTPADPQRTEQIVSERVERKLTLQQIADKHGISKERVRQILATQGISTGGRGRTAHRVSDKALETTLRQAGKRIANAEQKLRTDKEIRDRMILQAVEAGFSHAQTAEAAGVTAGRVNQIVQASRELQA